MTALSGEPPTTGPTPEGRPSGQSAITWAEYRRRILRHLLLRWQTWVVVAALIPFVAFPLALKWRVPWIPAAILAVAAVTALLVVACWIIDLALMPIYDADDIRAVTGIAPMVIPKARASGRLGELLTVPASAILSQGFTRCHFVSLQPGSGKSTLVAAVARLAAESGRTVLLVDADTERTERTQYGLPDNMSGLTVTRLGRPAELAAMLTSAELGSGSDLVIFDHGPTPAPRIVELTAHGQVVMMFRLAPSGYRRLRGFWQQLSSVSDRLTLVFSQGAAGARCYYCG